MEDLCSPFCVNLPLKLNKQTKKMFKKLTLYTNSSHGWERIWKTNTIHNSYKIHIHLGISLTKDLKNLSKENYKRVMKLQKKQQKVGKIIHVCGLVELIHSKCPHYAKQFTGCNQNIVDIFSYLDKMVLRFIWKYKRLWIIKA